MNIIELESANKEQCWLMIGYFLDKGCNEAVIKYTERLYEIIEFESIKPYEDEIYH